MKTIDKTEQTDATVIHNSVELLELSMTRAELDFVLRSVSKDTNREMICTVLLTIWTNGMISICSTDTHRLHTVVLRPALLDGGGLHPKTRILLSGERLKAFVRMHKPLSVVFFLTGDALTDVQFKGAKMSSATEPASAFSAGFLRPENYPQVHRVVPMDTGIAVAPFALNGRYLHDAMLSECERVVISGVSPTRPFVVTDCAHDGNPWTLRAFAVIMPMALPDCKVKVR